MGAFLAPLCQTCFCPVQVILLILLPDFQQVEHESTGAQDCHHARGHDFLCFGKSDAHDQRQNCLGFCWK